MIQHLKINDQEYPFLFSFRAIFSFMGDRNVESLQQAEQEMSVSFDAMLELYEKASEKGARKDNDFDGEPLSADDIEDALDEDPSLFMRLQTMFSESSVVKSFAGMGEETEKK